MLLLLSSLQLLLSLQYRAFDGQQHQLTLLKMSDNRTSTADED